MSDPTLPSQEFQSENVAVKVRREPGCTVVLDISISPRAVEAAYQKAIKNINKEISFPGFRKGHAPVQVIEQKFGKEIEQECRRIASEAAFTEAVNLCKLYPRTDKSVRNVDLSATSRQEGGQLHVEFESHPDVPDIDFAGFKFEPIEREKITDDEVEKTIYQLRLEKGTYEPVEGRPAQEGDIVMIDIDALVGEKNEPVRVMSGRLVEIGSPHNPAWLNKLLVGLELGASVDGEVDCSSSSHEGHSHGRRVTLLEINTGTIAPLSEQLLKEVGCSSEEMLRSQVAKQLERQEDHRVLENKSMQLEGFFAERYDFDVPKSMYESSARQLAQRQINALKKQEGWEEDFAAKSQAIHESVEGDLKRALRRFLLCDKVARTHNIQVSEQELYSEHIREVLQEGRSEQLDQDAIPRLYSKLLQQKVLSFLIDQVEAQ